LSKVFCIGTKIGPEPRQNPEERRRKQEYYERNIFGDWSNTDDRL